MVDPTLEFLFLAAVLLAVGILLRRVDALEKGAGDAHGARTGASPAEIRPAVDADTDTWALLVAPLSAILHQCELARGQRQMDVRMETVEKHAARMRDLLARLPGAERKIQEELEDVEPEATLAAAIESYSGLALDREVKVHMIAEPVPRVIANARLLQRSLRHLVRTAITSSPPSRGDVTAAVGLLPADGDPTHLAFAVADDGPGIEPARLVRILDPSIEEETQPTAEELAYSVVYALARAMGAQLTMTSAPGTGTRATIRIPLDRAALKQARERRRAASGA
jgi:signal transduction histidine kinase